MDLHDLLQYGVGVFLLAIGSLLSAYCIETGKVRAMVGGLICICIGLPSAIFAAFPVDWIRIWGLIIIATSSALFGILFAKPIRLSTATPFMVTSMICIAGIVLILYPSLPIT